MKQGWKNTCLAHLEDNTQLNLAKTLRRASTPAPSLHPVAPQKQGRTKDLVYPGHCCSLGCQKPSLSSPAPVASLGGGGCRQEEAQQCVSQQCPLALPPGEEETSKAWCNQDAGGIFVSFSSGCGGLQLELLMRGSLAG